MSHFYYYFRPEEGLPCLEVCIIFFFSDETLLIEDTTSTQFSYFYKGRKLIIVRDTALFSSELFVGGAAGSRMGV